MMTMMLPAIGSAAGGLLGQLGSALSAPRRALWSGAAGLFGNQPYESGADLVSGLTGMDSGNPLAQILGFGAEVATDPLTFAGGALGKIPSAVLGARTSAARNMFNTADDLVAGHAAATANNLSGTMQRFDSLKRFVDPETLAMGATRRYARPDPTLAKLLDEGGMAAYNAADDTLEMLPGSLRRAGFHQDAQGFAGKPLDFMQARAGRGRNLLPQGPQPTLAQLPQAAERTLLRDQAAQHGAAAFRDPAKAPNIFEAAAMQRAAQTAPAMPMLGNVPANQALGSARNRLTELLGQSRALSDFEQQALLASLAGGGFGAGFGFGGGMNALGFQGQ